MDGITRWTDDREAHHQATVAALHRAHDRLRDDVLPLLDRALSAAHASAPFTALTGIVTSHTLVRMRDDARLAEEFLAMLLVPAHLPLDLWRNGERWTQVRAGMSGVAGDLMVTNREVHVTWRGAAADAYHAVLPAHVAAAHQLADGADSLALATSRAGAIVATFYVALLAATLKGISSMLVGASAAIAGPAILVKTGLGIGGSVTFIEQLNAVVTDAVEAMSNVRIWTTEVMSEARNVAALPAGQWPKANTRWYNDATVTDGDADWSVIA